MITFEKLCKKAELLRKEYQAECEAFHWDLIDVGAVEEKEIRIMPGGAPTRILIYTPLNVEKEEQRLPLFISIHGGAFIRGSADFDDYFCRKTANIARCKVINIDFKLAPEYRFPYSVQECYQVLLWAARHSDELGIDPARIAVGGHQSGATMAAVTAQLARDSGEVKLTCMVLDSPIVTLADDSMDVPEFELDTPLTGAGKGAFFNLCYLGNVENAATPMASPDCVEDLTGMPDAFVLTAGLDPQTPKTYRYVERLRSAEVNVEYTCMEGCKHGFTVRAGLAPEGKLDGAWHLINSYLACKLHGQ